MKANDFFEAPSGRSFQLSSELKNLYQEAIADIDNKGKKFEDFCKAFFESIEGFECELNIKGPNEIDIMIANKSEDPFLSKLGPCIYVECKNRKAKVNINDVVKVKENAKTYYGPNCKLAILITTSELTRRAKSRLFPADHVQLVVINKKDLEEFFRIKLEPKSFLIQKIIKSPEKAK